MSEIEILSGAKGKSLCIVSDTIEKEFSTRWLRDSCQCSECIDVDSGQRKQLSFLSVCHIVDRYHLNVDSNELCIDWIDGHTSSFSMEALLSEGKESSHHRVLWDAAIATSGDLPEYDAEEFLIDSEVLKDALTSLEVYGFIFIQGVEVSLAATEAVARRLAYIRETIFGGLWDFTSNAEHKDSAYSSAGIEPHTDGTYSFDAPGYQMFHCLEFDGSGGESILLDGFSIVETLRKKFPEYVDILSSIETPGQHIDKELGVHLLCSKPVLEYDLNGLPRRIRFNMLDRAPLPYLAPDISELFFNALSCFHELANNESYQLIRSLRPGTMMIFDNWRTLHGRKAFSGRRRLAGAYLNKEDVESLQRVLG